MMNKLPQFTQQVFSKCSAFHLSLITVFSMMPVADFLLYQGDHLGITVTLFLFALGLASFIAQSKSCQSGNWKASLTVLTMGLMPMVETFNMLSTIIGIVATIASVILFDPKRKLKDVSNFTRQIGSIIAFMPVRLLKDMYLINKLRENLNTKAQGSNLLRNWLIPLILTSGFLWLFSLANPIIFRWIANIDLLFLLQLFDIQRMLFWAIVAVICWPLIRVRLKKLKKLPPVGLNNKTNSQDAIEANGMLNRPQVIRALILFNMLFAVQTFLDLFYLWGEGQLPEGVTYAQYVHRGTYILLTTTLLAAAFILFVTSKKRAMEQSALIRLFLLVWAAQNIFLVISTMMRMELYIEAYALTYLRVSALIWMFLVMVGLCLIVTRLLRGYSNGWLINANLISLSLTLYIASFANMPFLIGNYNVSAALNKPEKSLDIGYFANLGENTIPIIDLIITNQNSDKNKSIYGSGQHTSPANFERLRKRFVFQVHQKQKDWRQWSFRRWRLIKYIEQNNQSFAS